MFSWSSKLLRKVEKDRGTATSMVQFIAQDVHDRAAAGLMNQQNWEDLALDLRKTKPEMATIFNIANGILLSLSSEHYNSDIALFMRTILERPDPMVSIAQTIVEEQDIKWVITNSYSATVLEVLKALHLRGNLTVTVAESLPMGEGAMFAEALINCGIKIEIISDSMVFEWMNKVDAFICGTDMVSPHGIFNKMGSRAMATAANLASKKVLVVCDSMKLCPIDVKKFTIKREPSGKDVFRSIQMFELFPLNLLSEVITESGTFDAPSLENMFKNWIVDNRLRND